MASTASYHEVNVAEAAQIMARALLLLGQGHVYDPKCECAKCYPITQGIEVAKQVRTEG